MACNKTTELAWLEFELWKTVFNHYHDSIILNMIWMIWCILKRLVFYNSPRSQWVEKQRINKSNSNIMTICIYLHLFKKLIYIQFAEWFRNQIKPIYHIYDLLRKLPPISTSIYAKLPYLFKLLIMHDMCYLVYLYARALDTSPAKNLWPFLMLISWLYTYQVSGQADIIY